MSDLLVVLFAAFLAFAGCHYFLKHIWDSAVGCAVAAGAFAVLYVVIVGSSRF